MDKAGVGHAIQIHHLVSLTAAGAASWTLGAWEEPCLLKTKVINQLRETKIQFDLLYVYVASRLPNKWLLLWFSSQT